MSEKALGKKITSFVLVMSMIFISFTIPNSACATETVYDFSDAAQAEFDAQGSVINENSSGNFSMESDKKENKKRRAKNKVKKKSEVDANVNIKANEDSNSLVPDAVQDYIDYRNSVMEQQEPILKGQVVHIAAGTSFVAVLQSSVSSASLSNGDTIASILQDDWFYNGVLIAPQGSIIYGKTIEAEKAGGGYSNGRLSIMFDELLTPQGDKLLLTSNVVEIEVDNKRWWKVAANVVGGAAAGALGGILLLSGDDNNSKGAIIGAGVGGVLGGIRAATQKGEEVEIPAGTAINVRLMQPMNATPYDEM